MRSPVPLVVLAFVTALVAVPARGIAAPPRADPALLAALRPLARACGCVRSASWSHESYPFVTVDGARWNSLSRAERTRLARSALLAAERVYAGEWGTTDFYQRIFFADARGRLLFDFQP
jgi:hypothetical protein